MQWPYWIYACIYGYALAFFFLSLCNKFSVNKENLIGSSAGTENFIRMRFIETRNLGEFPPIQIEYRIIEIVSRMPCGCRHQMLETDDGNKRTNKLK